MRRTPAPASLAAGLALTALFVAGPAAAQWEVRPAPASWGGTVPQQQQTPPAQPPAALPPPVQPRAVPSAPADQPATGGSVQQTSRAMTEAPEGTGPFDVAVRCSAALQIATLAAPNWAREPGVADATNRWLAVTFERAEAAGVPGDRVAAVVEDEMQRQVSDAAADPSALSRRAFDCAAETPA